MANSVERARVSLDALNDMDEPEYVEDSKDLKRIDNSFADSGIQADDATDYSRDEGRARSMVDTVSVHRCGMSLLLMVSSVV